MSNVGMSCKRQSARH